MYLTRVRHIYLPIWDTEIERRKKQFALLVGTENQTNWNNQPKCTQTDFNFVYFSSKIWFRDFFLPNQLYSCSDGNLELRKVCSTKRTAAFLFVIFSCFPPFHFEIVSLSRTEKKHTKKQKMAIVAFLVLSPGRASTVLYCLLPPIVYIFLKQRERDSWHFMNRNGNGNLFCFVFFFTNVYQPFLSWLGGDSVVIQWC